MTAPQASLEMIAETGKVGRHHRPGRAGDRRRPRTDPHLTAIRPSGR
ncbi:MAG TPA: hypothetical protein VMV92_15280 [Streptosporangiaceae bacterium]|nr:hypothetical protein [Streptosporangiaceae bacterium]